MDSIKKRRTVVITLTHNCNLNCSYCYESHDTTSMNYDTLLRIVETEFDKVTDDDEIEFDFFGGEPFLEFDNIRKIVEYVEGRKWPKPYCFFATTNGTLINDEIKAWLTSKKNFYCGLSFDGTPEMNDINRCHSSKNIDLRFFQSLYPFQEIKMTVSSQTLDRLFEGVVFLEDNGFSVSCNLAYGIDWSNPNTSYLLEGQLAKLIEHYLEHPNLTPCRILRSNIDKIAAHQDIVSPYCGAGTALLAYDVDGKCYPCQLFMPLSCGNLKAEKASDLKFYQGTIPDKHVDPKCKDCVVKNICPTCYGANYIEFGNIYLHNDSYCRLTKIIMRARSYLRAKQWEYGQLNIDNEEEMLMLKSISLIQTSLRL